jgi:hypothetical protein
VDALVHSKKTEEIGRRLVRCGAAFPFPERGAEVIALGENGALTDVKAVGEGIQVEEATR